MKRNTLKDIILTILTKGITLLGSFLMSIMLARLLGPAGKGLVASLFVMPHLLTGLADLGIRQSAAYEIGRKQYSPQEVFSSSLILWLISSILSISILIGYYAFFTEELFSVELMTVAIIFLPVKILDTYYYGIHQGLQQIETINTRHILAFLGRFIWIVIFVWLINGEELGAASAMLVSSIVIGLYSFFKTKDILSFSFKYVSKLPYKLLKKGIVYALALFILYLNYRIDILLLTPYVSSGDIGIYSTGSSLAELIWQLPSAIAIVLFASSANKGDDEAAVKESIRILRVSLFIVTISAVVFASISRWVVPFLYGNAFIESSTIINLLLPGVVMIIIVQILHATMSGRGYPLMGFSALVVAIALNIILNLVIIPKYGINGAAVASTISYTVGGIGFSFVFSNKMSIPLNDFLIIKREDFKYLYTKVSQLVGRKK